jgi:cobalt-precorrin 5A hydrolase
MGDVETMIAIGIGCRRGASQQAIVALVRRALTSAQMGGEKAMLCTIMLKQSEAGLVSAADELEMPVRFYSLEELSAVESKIATRSSRVQSVLGIGSVCEAAALVGAGDDARLIVHRVVGDGVTCAVAIGSGP